MERAGKGDVKVKLQRKLNAFDVTNLVIGSIIGADIYVATGLSVGLIGPSSLIIWLLAGLMAMVIALAFAYCVMLMPRVGGPYAYVKEAFTPFAGFMVGLGVVASGMVLSGGVPRRLRPIFQFLGPRHRCHRHYPVEGGVHHLYRGHEHGGSQGSGAH